MCCLPFLCSRKVGILYTTWNKKGENDMDNKNKSLWDEMVSEVKKEFTPEEVKKMKKQKTKAAWWYQAGFYLLLAIAVAVGIIKCCMQIAIPLWCLWPAEAIYVFFAGLTPKAVQACDEENQETAAEFTFLGLTVLIAFIAFAIV